MKVHIFFPLRSGPWGGGNQFLKALRAELLSKGVYTEHLRDADTVLVNSHQFLAQIPLLESWKRAQRGVVVHRVDGPLANTRGKLRGRALDRKIVDANSRLADATIFQSRWSMETSLAQGLEFRGPVRIITNSADSSLFFPARNDSPHDKTRVITSSWSKNMRKGFRTLSFLDRNLNFDEIKFTFVGRSPVRLRNFEVVGPMRSAELGTLLRAQHIFFAPSKDDPCSNSLIEGIMSGLVPVYRRSGGHPEIAGSNGFSFVDNSGALQAIQRATELLGNRGSDPAIHSIPRVREIAEEYLDFFDFARGERI